MRLKTHWVPVLEICDSGSHYVYMYTPHEAGGLKDNFRGKA